MFSSSVKLAAGYSAVVSFYYQNYKNKVCAPAQCTACSLPMCVNLYTLIMHHVCNYYDAFHYPSAGAGAPCDASSRCVPLPDGSGRSFCTQAQTVAVTAQTPAPACNSGGHLGELL